VIAIVGMGAVFPGSGDAPSFWKNICSGVDAVTDVPADRWDPAVYSADFYCQRGGFLGDLAEFDPAPFGIMPAAVDGTEPDQLLMLRAAAEAIEDCGALPSGDRVGVIIGRGGYLTPGVARLDQRVHMVHQLMATLSDLGYDRLDRVRAAFEERLGPDQPESAIGLVPNFAASRLANRFDLHGPAYTVDAACASSLVAVDHAVRELTSGRCDAVLAGGVHTCHHPTLWSVFTRLRALSPGGVIRPLSASADGTLLSEGVGVVVLKRLADVRDERVYAVIRGVGISSDGRATSMMNPLVDGQELAIRRAWESAGLDPTAADALGLLEAHGTATPVGDRAELTALGRVFGPPVPGGRRIGIGTVKSMIGHAMPAAGIAGLIKAAYAVHEGVLPPTLHAETPHPSMAATRFEPVTAARPWDAGLVRRAAVSAFGFGGINAHVILEATGSPARARARVPAETVLRMAASSADELAESLRAPDSRLLSLAGTEPGEGDCRLAIVAPDSRRLALARKVAERGTPWRGRSDIWFTPRPMLSSAAQVAFLFPGFEPDFAPRVDGIAEAFGLPAPRLHGGDEIVARALDVVAVGRLYAAALAELGISPGAVAGHSLGEWTAMVVAGIYPEIDEFIASLRPGMVEVPDLVYLALGASAARAGSLIDGLSGVVLTHDNCTRQSVVCGPAAAIVALASRAREAGILAQVLPFRTGFHSPMFAPYTGPMREALAKLAVREPRVPVWSATSLAEYPREPAALADLVLRHLVEPVRFRQLTEVLYESGIRAFVQAGPGSLTGFADDTLEARDHIAIATAVSKRDPLSQLRRCAAALWSEGLAPHFDRLPAGAPSQGAAMSQRRPSRGSDDSSRPVKLRLGGEIVRLEGLAAGGFGAAGDPVLAELNALLAETTAAAAAVAAAAVAAAAGPAPAAAGPVDVTSTGIGPGRCHIDTGADTGADAPPAEVVEEREFSLRTMPDMRDHCLFPQAEGWPDDEDLFPVVPMTTLLEIMGDAALALAPGAVVMGFQQVRAMRWLSCAPATRAVVRAVGAGEGRVKVTIEGFAGGYVLLSDSYPKAPAPDETPLRNQRPAPVSAAELYTDGWMFHGPRFAAVANIGVTADDGITGSLRSSPARGSLLDSAGQLVGHWMQVSRTVDQHVLPTGIAAVRLYGPQPSTGQLLDCAWRIREVTGTEMRADAELRTPDGRVWCRIEGWTTRRFTTDDAIWRVKFHPEINVLAETVPGGWNVVRERWPDTASRELIVRRYLNTAERAEYGRLNPLQQRRWLLGRVAIKDAVRRWLWDRGAGAIYPAELTVADGPEVRGPFRAPPVSFAIGGEHAVAVAVAGDNHDGFTVGVDDAGAVLITEPGRPPVTLTP